MTCTILRQQETSSHLDLILNIAAEVIKKVKVLFLLYPITLEGRRGTTDEFATIPFPS